MGFCYRFAYLIRWGRECRALPGPHRWQATRPFSMAACSSGSAPGRPRRCWRSSSQLPPAEPNSDRNGSEPPSPRSSARRMSGTRTCPGRLQPFRGRREGDAATGRDDPRACHGAGRGRRTGRGPGAPDQRTQHGIGPHDRAARGGFEDGPAGCCRGSIRRLCRQSAAAARGDATRDGAGADIVGAGTRGTNWIAGPSCGGRS